MNHNQSGGTRAVVECSDDACSWRAQFDLQTLGGVRGFRCNWDGTSLQHSDFCMSTSYAHGLSSKSVAAWPAFQRLARVHYKSPSTVFSKLVREQLCLDISQRTLQRARNLVLGNKFELACKELSDIGAYFAAYVQLNPRDVADLVVDASNELVHWFLAFDNSGLAHGGLLPVLFCDGAHTKNNVCRRFILVISALNTEQQLVILAIACVKNESTETWMYMFRMFSKTALGQLALRGVLVLMSDRDGGLRAAARSVFPLAILRFCIIHVIKNAKQAGVSGNFRLLVKIAKTGSLDDRDRMWLQLQRSSPALVNWICKSSLLDYQIHAAPVVARGFAVGGCVTNNTAECANSKLLRSSDGLQSLREMTPAPMLREAVKIFSSQARRFRDYSLGLLSWPLQSTRLAVHMFMQQQLESLNYDVEERGVLSYLVRRRETITDLARHVWRDEQGIYWCDCCFAQQYRVLCRHILAVLGIGKKGLPLSRRLLNQGGIGDLWSKSNYVKAFKSLEVRPPSAAEVSACLQQTLFPRDVRIPAPVPQRGRPKKVRIKSITEDYRAAARRRAGLSAGNRGVMCSICCQFGHNMRSCELVQFCALSED